MFGCGVCAGTLSRAAWLSGAVLAGLMALKAGDCTSCLTPLTAGGDPAVLPCAAESGAIVEATPFGPVNGLAGAVGVAAFDGARRQPLRLSLRRNEEPEEGVSGSVDVEVCAESEVSFFCNGRDPAGLMLCISTSLAPV